MTSILGTTKTIHTIKERGTPIPCKLCGFLLYHYPPPAHPLSGIPETHKARCGNICRGSDYFDNRDPNEKVHTDNNCQHCKESPNVGKR